MREYMKGIKGKKILITRAQETENEFENRLKSFGASVEYLPTIEIKPINNFNELDRILARVYEYDGIFFTSTNSVKVFFGRLETAGTKFNGKIYAVGSKTKASVESFGYKVYFAPPVFSAEELADSLNSEEIKGKKFLFPRGNLGGEILKDKLGSISSIDDIIVYETAAAEVDTGHLTKIKNMLEGGKIDCISFFSPSSVENFMKIIPDFKQNNIKIAVIGNTTLKSTINSGLKSDIIPDTSTAENLAEAIADYFEKIDMT
jgi:uroporphyrinogen-III synthase